MKENSFFPEIKGNFGFGCMRLPMDGDKVNYDEFTKMADAFIDAGFNYFDTAHLYINGLSEIAISECVSKRYSREKFLIADKLSDPCFNSTEDIRPFFENQLKWLNVDYIDFYLMHAQDKNNYQKYKKFKAYETCYKLKEEGLIKHLGISFHDKAEVLDMILKEHPEVEFVQIQFNYADYDDEALEGGKVYDICEKYNMPVIVMEPVKGGSLVNLPPECHKILKDLRSGSNASIALRYAAGFPNMAVTLSGMSDLAQMEDNLKTFTDFKPLNEKENEAVKEVCRVFKSFNLIPCTGCRYCIEESKCPKKIAIPDMFANVNNFETFKNPNSHYIYSVVICGGDAGKASDCIKCGKCEKVCPQHLEIRKLLEKVVDTFETNSIFK
ncbi:MAG: aldo/keto reductase [Abditibacteriota bacterium]|nr:aldo/keto reductase [Abditibacteriota bacterium]